VGEAARLATHPLQDTLRQNRDIVLLDPRGTGYAGLAIGWARGWWSASAAALRTLSAISGVAFVWTALHLGLA
jgi:hypothetical protein